MLGRDMLNLDDLGADVDKQGLGLKEGVVEFKPKVTTTFEINQTPQLFDRTRVRNRDQSGQGPQAGRWLKLPFTRTSSPRSSWTGSVPSIRHVRSRLKMLDFEDGSETGFPDATLVLESFRRKLTRSSRKGTQQGTKSWKN